MNRLLTDAVWTTAFCVIVLVAASVSAQSVEATVDLLSPSASPTTDLAIDQPRVVAVVNGRSLLSTEVDQILDQLSFHDQTAQQRAQAIDLAVQRLLVLDYLKERQLGATDPELDLAMQRWKQHLASREVSPTDFYRINRLNEPALRRRFEWKIGWNRYRDKHLTDASIAKFFATHRQDFDGTRRRVAHILLSFDTDADAALGMARKLQTRISNGEITFSDAAKQFSIGTTADHGGELGWITSAGPMTAEFTRAAFELDINELSPPTRSPFGVHLIRCLEIELGKSTLADVLHDVRKAAELHLFRAAVKKQRPKSSVALR